MKRRKFIGITAGVVLVVAGTSYLISDKYNFTRKDIKSGSPEKNPLTAAEREILYLASLAPSGHNTQPWFVKYIEPYHWIIGNDKSKWLFAVDPDQRETVLSIGAFLQNLEYAANNLGYSCQSDIIAANNQEENIVEVKLTKSDTIHNYDIERIKQRRTIRGKYLTEVLKMEDVRYLIGDDYYFIRYIPNTTKEHIWLNEKTIKANRIQTYREEAQIELSEWIRFSSKDAEKYSDGLTTASMEIEGVSAWVLRNFYGKSNVMEKGFREQSINKVVKQVSQSAGWFLITSKDNSVASLIETGKRLQRLWLKVRDKNIALHPMTQIIEEESINQVLNQSMGIIDPIQFVLRVGYIQKYPVPVSLRRSVEKFIRT